jgi:hypothetical protein
MPRRTSPPMTDGHPIPLSPRSGHIPRQARIRCRGSFIPRETRDRLFYWIEVPRGELSPVFRQEHF